MLAGSGTLRDEAPLHTFHENIEQDTGDLQLQWGGEMGEDNMVKGGEVVQRSEEKAGA